MENNKKQTAVEQFLDAIKNQISLSNEHLEMIESYASQAKEIEKQQVIEFLEEYDSFIFRGGDMSEEEYYDYTFKQD